MVSVLQNVAIDCADAYELARFWSRVTGRPLNPEDQPGDPEAQVLLAEGPALHFNQMPEAKTIKNRIHLCLCPETSREQEVERLLSLGAPSSPITGTLTAPAGRSLLIPRATNSASCAASPTEPPWPEGSRRPRRTEGRFWGYKLPEKGVRARVEERAGQ